MQHLEYQQIEHITKFSQILLFNLDGYIQESCDTLFSTSTLRNKPVFEWMPFMESIFESLKYMQLGSSEIRFTKIEIPAKFLPGYYDFTFSKVHLQDKESILWCIFDYSDLYSNLMQVQQQHNELEIYRQLFELGNKTIQHPSDILSRKNFFKDYFSKEVNKGFHSKLQELLLTHDNIFDIFSLLKNKGSQQGIDDLSQTINAFGAIKDDYEQILKSGIKESHEIGAFKIPQIIKDIKSIIEQKIKNPFRLNFSHQSQEFLLGNKHLLTQVLFNLFVSFFEQFPQTTVNTSFSVVTENKKDTHLNINIQENTPIEIKSPIKKPTGLIIRMSLIKKLLQNNAGKITAQLTPSNLLNINIQIPCQIIS